MTNHEPSLLLSWHRQSWKLKGWNEEQRWLLAEERLGNQDLLHMRRCRNRFWTSHWVHRCASVYIYMLEIKNQKHIKNMQINSAALGLLLLGFRSKIQSWEHIDRWFLKTSEFCAFTWMLAVFPCCLAKWPRIILPLLKRSRIRRFVVVWPHIAQILIQLCCKCQNVKQFLQGNLHSSPIQNLVGLLSTKPRARWLDVLWCGRYARDCTQKIDSFCLLIASLQYSTICIGITRKLGWHGCEIKIMEELHVFTCKMGSSILQPVTYSWLQGYCPDLLNQIK